MDSTRADALLQLVFHGECLDGQDPLAVRLAVAEALKLDEKRAARLFSGRRVVLRRGVGAAAAQRHIARFALMGARLRAEPSTPHAMRRAPAPKGKVRAAGASPPWRRPLRWLGIGVLGVVAGVVIGIVLWPLLGALWPDTHRPDAAASWAAADVPPSPPSPPAARATADAAAATPPTAAAPMAAADSDIPQDMSAEAVREHKLGYVHAHGHKGFAISAGGAHAWHAGANTANEASEGALASCMAARRPGDDGCRIVDLDGQWQE